jgi:serine O-acetyltransferase
MWRRHALKLEICHADLVDLVIRQIDNLFGLGRGQEREVLVAGIDTALKRSEFCFSHVTNKYYNRNGEAYFNPFHSGQYAIFLYYLSNSIFSIAPDARTLADRVYFLNKALNCLDLFYEVRMPSIFFLDHAVGSVMGRANYGDYFLFGQNCTVGNNKGVYPKIGRNVRMGSGSKILGNCTISDNVIVSANTYVKDADIPSCSLVFGASPRLVLKAECEQYFKTEFRYEQ